MKRIEIDTNTLNRNINALEENISAIKAEIDKTYDGIRVLDGMWDGPANAEFNKQFSLDYARLLEICDHLTSCAQKLDQARVQYEDGESHVAQIVAALRV